MLVCTVHVSILGGVGHVLCILGGVWVSILLLKFEVLDHPKGIVIVLYCTSWASTHVYKYVVY